MAQHYLIFPSQNQKFRNLTDSIVKRFSYSINKVFSSIKYVEIKEDDFRNSVDDIVFHTTRAIRGKKEDIEIHYNSRKSEISSIFIIK